MLVYKCVGMLVLVYKCVGILGVGAYVCGGVGVLMCFGGGDY